ncbi:non-ribosomal peptide synthetase [Streptomyces sp. RerS4]|uniref:non-ribosomal peptide synthetase n=1 Tax=Streptomyces sp. RerS4 TaxID=2942449 RepID=UPI00201BDCD3|nr:non-ribosomal peptide synthetase [Streptomyces sp. RerS4]UQW99646.1 amino acid adenylation domain-containing protein [Streptomyces sp. RerS4]
METPLDAEHRLDIALLARWDAHPERIAILDGDDVVLAGEVRDRAVRIAALLREHGVRPGDRVAVLLERSADFVIAVAAVVLAGGAHVAIDTANPVERVDFLLRDCAPRLLLTSTALRAGLPEDLGTRVLTMEECAGAGGPTRYEPADALADRPAVVIYTSGSTGRPKGSLLSHRAVTARLRSLQNSHPIDENDRVLHHTACTFDMFLVEVYWPLLHGAPIVVAAPGRQRDPGHLAQLMRDHEVSTVWWVVSLLELFLLALGPGERVDGLRQVLTGGEALSPELVRRFHERSRATLSNLYGPSECTMYCTAWVCPRDPDPQTVMIGSAIEDTSLWILDEHGRPVPEGQPGELYIGGVGVSLGYHDRPELTAERFVEDTLGATGGRLYRSGDLVRAHPSGDLEYLGRVDRQVKIRGFRIEPGEIEGTALRVPGVRQAAVVADGTGSATRLVGFVVLDTGEASAREGERVRGELAARLPAHLVPAAIVPLERFPLTPNGKLDHGRLTEWAADAVPVTADAVPVTADSASDPVADPAGHEAGSGGPVATDMEALVAEVWAKVLGVPSVGPLDDFFGLGGDSFRAVRVVRELEERTGLQVPMYLVFESSGVAEFAEAVTASRSGHPTGEHQ